jgi:hypothetical protein
MVSPVFGAAGTQPILYFNETDAGADQKIWEVSPLSTVLSFRAFNDAYNSSTTWMNVVRGTGTAVTGVDVLTRLSVTNNGAGARWIGTDHFYHEFYPDGLGAGRKGYLGYPAASNDNLTIANEISGAHINLLPTGAGRVGIGTSSPQAELHTYDTDAGTLHNWRTTGIAGSRVTIVPNGTGDCVQSCSVFGTAYDSSGNAWELRGALESGVSAGVEQTVQVAGDATDNLHVKVKTDGQVEIVRNAGARTWSVCLSAWWR